MLKINLLPEHFALVRRTKQLIALFSVLALAVLALWIGYDRFVMQPNVAEQQARIDEFKPKAAEVDRLEANAHQTAGKIPAFKAPVAFVKWTETVPEGYVRAFESVNEYIFANARMLNFAVSGDQIQISAEVNSTTDVGRFYLNILECPYITNIGFSAWTGGGGGGGRFGGGGGDDDDDEEDDGPSGAFGGGRGGGAGAVAGGRIPISVSATLRQGIPLRAPGGAAGGAPAGPARPAGPPGGAPPSAGAGAAGGGMGAMPSAAAPGGGVIMPEEM